MSIWAMLIIAVLAIRLYTYYKKIRSRRIISHSNATITHTPLHWTIEAEIGTMQHQICEDAALKSTGIRGDYETFIAETVADKTEYDKRIALARKAIAKETAKRLSKQ